MKGVPEGEARVVRLEEIAVADRYRKNMKDLEDLAESIKEKGLINPLTVEEVEGGYSLLAGGRRFGACLLAGLEEAPTMVHKNLDDFQRRSIELHENIKREDMEFEEKSALTAEVHRLYVEKYGERVGEEGHSQADTARVMGVTPQEVGVDLKIAKTLEDSPEVVKGAKNRSDAQKMIRKHEENKLVEEQARRAEEKTPKSSLKGALLNCYRVADFFEWVQDVPDSAFNVAEVDPPYGIDLDTSHKHQQKGMMAEYHEVPKKEYVEFTERVVKELSRTLTTSSWILYWGTCEWQDMIRETLNRHEFKTTTVPAIWVRTGGSPGKNFQPEYMLGSQYELIIYARRGNAKLARPGLGNSFLFDAVPPSDKNHPTEKPIELMEELLSRFTMTHERIICPFLGSGNTILAAANLGIQCVGADLSQVHRDRFVERATSQEFKKYHSYAKED